jgi:hypothetical protein
MRYCKQCNRLLEDNNFYISSRDSFMPLCEECQSSNSKIKVLSMIKNKDLKSKTRYWTTRTLTQHRRKGRLVDISSDELQEYINQCRNVIEKLGDLNV